MGEGPIIMEVQHTILIADDNRLIREVYRALLELEGFTVVEASNGAEALIWCLRETADVILLDLEMPVLDGWSFLEYRLRQPRIRDIPVVVVTSQPDTSVLRQDFDRLRAERLLQKPVLREDLINAVRNLLARPSMPAVPLLEEALEGAKRRDPRVVFSIPIRVRMRSSSDTSGRLRDLSAGGLGAYLPRRLTEGDTVTVSFDIEGRSLALMGLVKWAGESLSVGGYRHGIRFTDKQDDVFPLNAYSFFREHSGVHN
ncbi:MAG: response regulator [Candidatus Binatia bacterium]